ncbi:MAG: sodium:calcium antiporter [Rhodospirillales bacterium]|nr:sodium:calcium antiporter [Rhodospirillales bacterium]MCB9995543.1 sodium:calcium antiporter [Rhodospirillales bacterium]
MTGKHRHDKQNFSLRTAFRTVADYARENKLQSGALLTSLLLGSTALATPLLTTTLGAAAVMAGSIALLIQNAETAVANTLAMGKKLHLPSATLGLIIGSLNTVPEVAVSLSSAMQGAIELGIGNIVGSNVAHTLFILGATAAVAGIQKAKDARWKFNTLVMAGTTAMFGSQMILGSLSPWAGAAMLALGGYYLKKQISSRKGREEHNHDHDHHHEHDHNHNHGGCGDSEISTCLFHDHDHDEHEDKAEKMPKWMNAALTTGGMAGLVMASDLIVRSAISFTDKFNLTAMNIDFGVSQAVAGAVIVAIGTSLPELSINLKAIRKKQGDFAVANVLGCSITNTLIAGGVLSLSGADVPAAFNPSTTMGLMNIGAFIGSAGILTATLLASKGALKRWQGAVALGAYGAYLGASIALGNETALHQHTAAPANTTLQVVQAPAFPPPKTLKI